MFANSEIHLIIIWEKALDKEEEILNYLSKKFELIRKLEIIWNPKNVDANFSRFYGENLPKGSHKEIHCGSGKFLALIVEDQKPLHGLRETTKGKKIVNTNIFDCKQLFREWTGGGHKIHASNDDAESRRDIALLLGIDITKDLNLIHKYNDTLTQDLIGTNGWASFDEIFYVLNATTNYVVLRNAEDIGPKLFESPHPDIDLLVKNVEEAKYILNVTSVFPEEYRVHFVNFVGSDKVYWDLRSPNDGYMSDSWCDEILKLPEMDNSGRNIPSLNNLFWSRIYHALVHKNEVSQDYIFKSLEASALIFGHRFSILRDKNVALIELASYMALNGYDCPTPRDKSVHFSQNAETLIELIKIFSRFLGLFKSTYPLSNLVNFKEIVLIETSFMIKIQKMKLYFFTSIFKADIYAQNTINTTVSNKSIYFALEPITHSNWFNFRDIVSRGSENSLIFYTYQIRNPKSFLESKFQFPNFKIEELLIFNLIDKIKLSVPPELFESINSKWVREKIYEESPILSIHVEPRLRHSYIISSVFQNIKDFSVGSIVHISEKKEDRLKLTFWFQSGSRRLPFSIINRVFENNHLIIKKVSLVDSSFEKNITKDIIFDLKSEPLRPESTLLWDLVGNILEGNEISNLIKQIGTIFNSELTSTHNSKIAKSKSDTISHHVILNNSYDLHLNNFVLGDEVIYCIDNEFLYLDPSHMKIVKLRMLVLTLSQLLNLKLLKMSEFAKVLDFFNSLLISNFTEREIIRFIELETIFLTRVTLSSSTQIKDSLTIIFMQKNKKIELDKEFYLKTYSNILKNNMKSIELARDIRLGDKFEKIEIINHQLLVENSNLNQVNANLNQEINFIYNSRSWKIITLYRRVKSKYLKLFL